MPNMLLPLGLVLQDGLLWGCDLGLRESQNRRSEGKNEPAQPSIP